MKKSIVAFLMLIVIAIVCCSCQKSSSDGIKTTYNHLTGTLTVSGEGTVENLLNHGESGKRIKRIIIEEGIEGIWNSFNGISRLREIRFPSTLGGVYGSFNEVGVCRRVVLPTAVYSVEDSFNQCEKLSALEIEGKIAANQSFNSLAIEELIIPENSKMAGVFNDCKNLKRIVVGENAAVEEYHYFSSNGEGYVDIEPDYSENRAENFSGCSNHINVYRYLPKAIFEHSMEDYNIIEVPEGTSWEDYLEKR